MDNDPSGPLYRSLANHLFLTALVTPAAGFDSASKVLCFCTKVGVARVQSGRDHGQPHSQFLAQDRFYTV